MGIPILTAIGIGASVLGTAVQVFGQLKAGRAQSEALEYQAKVDANNAIIAARLAADARSRGVSAEQEHQLQTKGLLGRQKAVLASRNIDVTSGSALDIIGDTAMFSQVDALTIRHNYEREAIALETQQGGFEASAELARRGSRDALTAGRINAFSTLLGGVGSVVSKL